ncbi:MAG: hypothetical protein ACW9W3_04960 [Candidatus Nitrosopumilus sp. bin_68KS]
MSESGDQEFPTDVYGYYIVRSNLLISMNQLRDEIRLLWKDGKKWNDKKFDANMQTLATRKQELLDIAHGIMTSEDYEQYLDIVELTLPLKYHKFDFRKLKKVNKDFSPKKLT